MTDKLFRRSGAAWLVCVGIIYLIIGLLNWKYKFIDLVLIQICFVIMLALPILFKPLGRWLQMDV